MKKTIILSALLLAVAFFFAIDADAQKGQGKKTGKHNNSQMHNCPNFVDANGDGKCDSFVDANGDGKCDNCTNANCTGSCDGKMGKGKHCQSDSASCGMHKGHGNCANGSIGAHSCCSKFVDANGDGKCDSFVDANGDGKCDNCTNANCSGTCDGKMGKGKHGKNGKSCGHKCSDSSATPDANMKMLGTDEKSIASNISTSPMPATNEVKINFTLEQAGTVSIDVFDRTGNKVANVFSGNLDAKDHSFVANTASYANGTYFFRITVNGQQTTQKMLISK